MKQFKLNPNRGWQKNEQFMPPPILTNENLPFNWAYHQNPHITASINEHTGETVLTNKARARKTPLQYLAADVASVPQSSPFPVPEHDAILLVVDKLKEALNERPVWTRRALGNRVGHEELPVAISTALHHVAYQFKGGPFRDTIIKYGVDPRTDKEYRKYQTLFFQMYEEDRGPQKQWKDMRTAIPLVRNIIRTDTSTHIFDGKTLALDGKVWQLCDITDPLLRRIIDNAQLREYDAKGDGYFCNGSWAKIQAIMKTKFLAIRARVAVETLDFQAAIDMPDIIEDNKKDSHRIVVPVPDVRLTDERVEEMIKEGIDVTFLQQNGIKKRGRKMRTIRISQKLETAKKSQKRNYTKSNPVDGEKSLRAEIADKLSKESEERTSQGQMVPNKGPSSSSSDNNKAQQINTPSDEYMTAEEHVGRAEEGVEGEGDEEEMNDDDIGVEGRETDEEDNSGSERNEEQGVGEEEVEYDSDTTDILDPGAYFKPLSRPQSRS
jgi:general transcription factor 3C polypeptide 5 (transcription factor C subunit 1)